MRKSVLLSIKPDFAFKIFEGTKKYEFRKSIFKSSRVEIVVVYASSPVQKVIGEFEIENILSAYPEDLWEKTKKYSGITKEYFHKYFADKQTGYAIKIKTTKRYQEPLRLKEDFDIQYAPQSFIYI